MIPPKLRKNYAPPKPKKPSRWQIEVKGVVYRSLREACRTLDIEIHTYRNRLNRGCTVEQSLGLEPIVKKPRKGAALYEIDGEKLCLNDISRKYGIDPTTFKRRVERGISTKEAIIKPIRKRRLKS